MKVIGLFAVVCLVVVATGCVTATYHPPPKPLTQEEIIQLSQAHMPDAEVIQKIRASGTVYRLSTTEILHLHEAGVSNNIIDFMLQDYVEAARARERQIYGPYYYYGWQSWGAHSYWCRPQEVIVVPVHH